MLRMNSLNRKDLVFLIFICLSYIASISSSSDKKSSKIKVSSCDKFEESLNSVKQIRAFIPTKENNNDKDYTIASLNSVQSIYDDFFKTHCIKDKSFDSFNQQLIELKWRFQFFESIHCIRVELDFGNLTHFKSYFNYDYFRFSYRELSKKNIHLRRHPLQESLNTLTIHKVHLKPYIVCVTFYKNNFKIIDDLKQNIVASNNSNSTDDNSIKKLECNEYSTLLSNDNRMHDVDLCIDIDTHLHFLSMPVEPDDHFAGTNRELLMVIFIMCLLVIILGLITLSHYLIEKPKKRRMLKALRTYLHKKSHPNNDYSTQNLHSSSQAILNTLKENRNSVHGPAITVTDYSLSNTALNMNSNNDLRESEPLISSDSNVTNSNQQQHKVTFSIGETIVEEPSLENEEPSKQNQTENTNDESLKSVSHLLDDKPWQTSYSALLGNCHRGSRANSFLISPNTNAESSNSNLPNSINNNDVTVPN